jgi:hypothetical protein
MKKLNCTSCGGLLTQIGPGKYECTYCNTLHQIEAPDVNVARADRLDDEAIGKEIELVQNSIVINQRTMAKLQAKLDISILAQVIMTLVVIGGSILAVMALQDLGPRQISVGGSIVFGVLACVTGLVIVNLPPWLERVFLRKKMKPLGDNHRRLEGLKQEKLQLLSLSEPPVSPPGAPRTAP